MSLTSRRRTAATAAVFFMCLYVTLSLVDRRRELQRREMEEMEAAASFSFAREDLDEVLEQMREPRRLMQGDPRLVDAVRSQFIIPPFSSSNNDSSSSSAQPKPDSQATRLKGQSGQPVMIDRLLQHKKGGFFVEAGAFDGEYLSNTLFFETRRNWTGLLVEPSSRAFNILLGKRETLRPRSSCVHACLALNEWPEEVEFDSADVYGGVVSNSTNNNGTLMEEDNEVDVSKLPRTAREAISAPGGASNPGDLGKLRDSVAKEERKRERVQCIPFYTLLLAMGNPVVDYLSLDVEGAEISVLRTIPWQRVKIRTASIEVAHSDTAAIVAHMVKAGFRVIRKTGDDVIFSNTRLV